MHKAVVAQFEIAAKDPDVVRRFYALLFGWGFSLDGAEPRNSFVTHAASAVGGLVISAGDGNSGGLSLSVEVDDVFENLCYADELGGKVIDLPHQIISDGRPVTVASFADPEGNRVRLANGLQQSASARQQ